MKTFLPPFVAFVVFGVFVAISVITRPMQVGDMGEGNLHAFMACFYYCWPLYFLAALLTQFVFIVGVWQRFIANGAATAITAIAIVGIICLLFAAGVAYAMWDEARGRRAFMGLTFTMLMIQLAYWAMNFIVMAMLSGKAHPPVAAKAEE